MNKVIAVVFVLTAGVLLLGIRPLQAGTQDPGVNVRQKMQHERIREGAQSGELTAGEAVQLKAQQGRIRRSERRMKADGELTAEERARLQRKQNRANRNINRKKHNDRKPAEE